MDRIPLGISELDSRVGGGAVPGNLVLLVGEIGAGARQLMYTSAVMNGLAQTDPGLFDLHYGTVPRGASLPNSVHYISFTEGKDELRDVVQRNMDDELVQKGFEGINHRDFSEFFFKGSRVPEDWYSAGASPAEGDLIDEVEKHLQENASHSLVLIDSLNDMITVAEEHDAWEELIILLKGMRKALRSWKGLVLAHVTMETLDPTRLAELEESADGVIYFNWEEARHERVRTVFFKKLLSVFPRTSEMANVFEAGVRDEGYYISMVEKVL